MRFIVAGFPATEQYSAGNIAVLRQGMAPTTAPVLYTYTGCDITPHLSNPDVHSQFVRYFYSWWAVLRCECREL